MDELDYLLPANGPNPYFDTWDRHNSIAFSATKGLRNAPGENNCFVNCAVQVFWHLDVFRRSYRRLSGHTCMGNSCIFCALKVIFTQFQYSDKASLHPDALRKALAETFANQQRFQLGHMDDAAECFENILRRIHFHIANNCNEDSCTAPHCLPHQKFSMRVQEKVLCPCGISTNPLKFSEMVHYVSASALVSQSRIMQENGDALHPGRFGLLLRKASTMGDVRDCPANCGRQVQKQRTLLNVPDVVSVGLVWDSDHPTIEMTTEVASCLRTTVLLQDMYHCVMPDLRTLPQLHLVAMVCYYGKHYSTFVFHSKLRIWIYFDDATVREIGPQWENVVEKCSRGRFQPLLLLYANPSATPVSVDTAPRKRVMAPGFAPTSVMMSQESDCILDRTQDSIKNVPPITRRSCTPNPDQRLAPNVAQGHSVHETAANQENGRDSPGMLSRDHARQPSFLYAVSSKTEKGRLLEGGAATPIPGTYFGVHSNAFDSKSLSAQQQQLNAGTVSGRPEDEYATYTLSGGNQYRRPSHSGPDQSQLPMPPNTGRMSEVTRKNANNRSLVRDKCGADVVRYQIDPNKNPLNSQTYNDGYIVHKGLAMPDAVIAKGSLGVGQPAPPVHNGHQHSSAGQREDKNTENGLDLASSGQHVVLKPKPTGHGYHDSVEGVSSLPLQSGFSTLPRHRMHTLASDLATHQQSGQEMLGMVRPASLVNLQLLGSEPPLPPGTPPPEYQPVDIGQKHSRQASNSTQTGGIKSAVSMSHIELISTTKKSDKTDGDKSKKKNKKDKKSEKSLSKKSDRKKSSKLDVTTTRKSDSDSEVSENKLNYINPLMVETILKHQGVHRQNSSCSNNSVSSVESDSLMGRLITSKGSTNGGLSIDVSYDNVSLGSHKDSGYGSSDRNSSSSTGSGTIDPCVQYFLSKSMVVPRTVNTQMVDHHHHHGKMLLDSYSTFEKGHQFPHYAKDVQGEAVHHSSEVLPGRKIMHPIKESSQEDVLKFSRQEDTGGQKLIIADYFEQCPPPVPPKNLAQFQIIKSAHSSHQRDSSLDSLDKDDTMSDRFVMLYKKADALMDSCMLAETQDDFMAAFNYCETALKCLEEAMAQKELSNKALNHAQKKHSSCYLKSQNLQKQIPMRPQSNRSPMILDLPPSISNRSSFTSSDSDLSESIGQQLKSSACLESKAIVPRDNHTQQVNANLYQGVSNPVKHSERNSDPNRSGVTQQESGGAHIRMDSNGVSCIPSSNSANNFQYITSGVTDNGSNSADLYGTLPRNKSRKPTSDTPANPDVYQSFLNKQKCLQAGVHSSQQSLDSVKSDSGGSDHSSTASNQQKMTKADIRKLLQENILQRPRPQNSLQQQVAVAVPQMQQTQQLQQQQQQIARPQTQQTQQQIQGSATRHSQSVYLMQQQQQQSFQYQQAAVMDQCQSQQQILPDNCTNKLQPNYHQQQPTRRPSGSFQQPQPSQVPLPSQSAHGHASVPIQKPAIPYPSSLAKSRAPPVTAPVHTDSSEVGKRNTQNVAQVVPNLHVLATPPASGGSYLVMLQHAQHPIQALPSHLQHSASSMQLTVQQAGSKPLERCSSQNDYLQHSGPAYPTNSTDAPRSVYADHEKLSISPLSAVQTDHKNVQIKELSKCTPTLTITSDVTDENLGPSVNVRALASRFESSDSNPIKDSSAHQNCHRRISLKKSDADRPQGPVTVQRTRSKSESFSRKPKSVLKNKKSKSRPRKSVTFAESIANFLGCDELNSGYESARESSSPREGVSDRVYYSDNEDQLGIYSSHSDNELDDVEDSSNSDDSPVPEDEACKLCGKRRNETGKQFCEKCCFYMGKLKSLS